MAKIVEFKDIPLENLAIGKGQARLSDVGRDIDELANSIDKVGLLESHPCRACTNSWKV